MYALNTSGNLSQQPELDLVQEGIAAALNLAGVGVWEHFPEEKRSVISDGVFGLVGVTPTVETPPDEFWFQRIHPEDRPRVEDAYKDFLQGSALHYEQVYRTWHEEGRWISVLARARWVPATEGRARTVLGYIIDVTEHSQGYQRLRVREERFRMSVSALRGMAYAVDLRTNTAQRHGLKRLLGYDKLDATDDFAGWITIVHPDDQALVYGTVAAHRASGTNCEISYRVRHADGRWLYVRHRATYKLGKDGKPERAFGIVEDVNDAYEQQEQLQMQAAIIERMSEGVMLLARDGTILFANPALERLFGYSPGQLTGKSAQLLSFRSSANFEGLMRTAFEGTENGRTSVIDLEGRRRDDTMCPVQGYLSAMKLGDRRCVVAVMTDITERKQLEREMMQIATRVQQRIGGDLHDGLGQQLAGIAMMLQGLGQRATNAGSPAMRAEVEEIVSLVNAAIRSTRSLARGLSPVRPSRDGLIEGFEELVNQVVERYQIHVKMELRLPPELLLEENVATNLFRIAQEGVLNAARHADATTIHLRFRIAGPDVELLVIDDGKGFDPLQFARGGMGIRIMRFRAQLVGGYLSVESGLVPARHCVAGVR